MSDYELRIGASTGDLQRDLARAERAADRAAREIARSGRQVAAANRAYAQLAKEVARAEGQFEGAGKAAEEGAEQAASPKVKEAGRLWLDLAKILADVGIAYLAITRGSRDAADNSRSLASTLAAAAAAVASVETLRRGFLGLVDAGSQFEQLRVQLNGLYGSAALGGRAFDWIQDQTVRVAGFQEAFVTLKNFGLDPLDGTLSALNDTVGRLGDGNQRLQRISLALGQGFAANALRAEELNQLVDAGVPVFDVFSRVLGVSAGQVRELASEGRIGRTEIRAFIDELGRVNAGGAEQNLQTLSGTVGQLQRTFRELAAEVAQGGLLEFLRSQIQALLDEIERLRQTGELQTILQNLSRAITNIARGVASVIQALVTEFAKLAGSSGGLVTFADAAQISLQRLATVLGFVARQVVEYRGALVGAFLAFKGLQIALQVAGWLALAGAIFKVATVLRALGLAGVLARLGAAPAVISAVTGAVNVLTFSLRNFLLMAGRVALVLGPVGIAAAGFAALVLRAKRAADDAEEALRQMLSAADEYIDVVRQLREQDLGGIADQLRGVATAWREGTISTEEFLRLTRQVGAEALDLDRQLTSERQRLAELRAQIEAEAQAKILAAEKERLQASIEGERQSLAEKKSLLQEEERAEQAATQRIAELRQQLAGQSQSLEDRISDIRRKGMSDRRASYRAESEAIQETLEISRLVVLARQAETDAERETLLAQAKSRQQRAEQLAGEVDSITRQESLARRLSGTQTQLLREEIALQQDRQTAARESQQTLVESIEQQQKKLDDLTTTLENLGKETTTADVDANISDALDNIVVLQEKLKDLERGITIPVSVDAPSGVSVSGGAGARGFARGGPVPGSGSGDTVPAWLTPGEYVIRKDVVGRFGRAFFEQLNAARMPRVPDIPAMSHGRQAFADGGLVGADMGSITITLPGGSPRRVSGPRDTLDALRRDAEALARGLA